MAATVALGLLLTAVVGVAAQADWVSSDPAPGSTVSGSPSTIRIDFSQPLQGASRLDLFTGQFRAVGQVTTQIAGSELRGVLGQPLLPATYTVQWTAITEDGVATAGSYQFAVAPQSRFLFGARPATLWAAGVTFSIGVIAICVLLVRRRRGL